MIKKVVLGVAVSLVLNSAVIAAENNLNSAEYLTISQVRVQELSEDGSLILKEEVTTADLQDFAFESNHDRIREENRRCRKDESSLAGLSSELDQIEVILDKIINIGKKIWVIVEANKPIVAVNTNSATALPEGVHAWHQLSGWKNPRSKVYRVVYVNLLGMDVVDFSYRVLYTYGGSLDGKGLYVAKATVVPADLSVAWAYKFNADIEVPSVLNVGSAADPIGGIELQVSWTVDTVLKHHRKSAGFFVRGDGVMVNLTNGN